VDHLEDGVERVLVAREDHPAGERARARLVERVEGEVDDLARLVLGRPALVGARFLDQADDARADGFGEAAGQRALEPGGRAEMVQQIGVGAADPGGDGLQRHCLRPGLDQDRASRLQRGVA